MKIEITTTEQNLIQHAISVKEDQLKRAINTEKDEDVKELRVRTLQQYTNLKMKIMTGELHETPISKQK